LLLDGKLLLKVSDFGLARQQNDLSPTGLPYPMSTPPEALREMADCSVWTTKCDAWQFGLLICDVLSCGKNSLSQFNFSVQALLDALSRNWMPERPALCNDAFWYLVQKCLQQNPIYRPEFVEIVAQIEHIFSQFKPL
jgi:serine/threonine protein kinase